MYNARHHWEGVAFRRSTAGGNTARLQTGADAVALPASARPVGAIKDRWFSMVYDYSDLADDFDCSVAQDRRAFWDEPLALVARLRLVERLLVENPDAAALVLDGVLWGLVLFAFERVGQAAPSREDVFESLDALASPACWRLRLALRAPNAHARLIHIWAFMDALSAIRGVSVVSEKSRAVG